MSFRTVTIIMPICSGKNEVEKMNSDFITAIIIVGGFFLFLFGVFADAFIREWIANERMKRQ